MMRFTEGVDAGDIVAPKPIPITPLDNVATLYDRVAETNCEMILEFLENLAEGSPLQARHRATTDRPCSRGDARSTVCSILRNRHTRCMILFAR